MFAAPVGQAVLLLRKKIAEGAAPGLAGQTDLFTDAIGHAKPPLAVLVGYCYYAQIYGRSPVGLPVPPALKGSIDEAKAVELNRLLQQIAWQAVTEHPLSGVTAGGLSDDERAAGFTPMFNGRDFTGWRFTGDVPPEKVANWKVAGGVIQLSGGGSPHLATEREYADFEMRFEWRGEPSPLSLSNCLPARQAGRGRSRATRGDCIDTDRDPAGTASRLRRTGERWISVAATP